MLPSINTNSVEHAESAANTTEQQSKQDKIEALKDFSIEDDTLYDLLVAEIAAQRNQINISLLNYIQQARITRDPAVIKRAINAAQFAKDPVAINELGQLWLEVEPENPSAHQLMAYQFSIAKQYGDAIHHIDKVIELGGRISVESLAIGSQSLPDDDKRQLLALYQKLESKHPDSNPVRYSTAIVLANLEEYDQALTKLDEVIDNDENFEVAYILKANLLIDQKSPDAFEFSQEAYEHFPKNHALGRIYASLLIEQKRLDEAEEIFGFLVRSYPQQPAFKLSQALVMMENQKLDEASTLLQQLLSTPQHQSDARYYLGRIAEAQEQTSTAIEHYLEIDKGPHLLNAKERAVNLLLQQQRYEEAYGIFEQARKALPAQAIKLWASQYQLLNNLEQDQRALDTLNQAIVEHPESQELLYARAMHLDQNQQAKQVEADLRRIIELNPQNAVALNALGYTLADRGEHLDEAFAMISQAFKLKPESPAIMDSMGWVLFKLGRREESLVFLLRAFKLYSDGEVGGHLGEVLFSLNQKTEAFQVWQKALELDPEHPVLRNTIERLAPELLEQELLEQELPESAPDTSPASK